MGAVMTSQKDSRLALLGVGLARANSPQIDDKNAGPQAAPTRVVSGAVGAVSRTLDKFQSDIKAAQDLVSSGEHVVELDAALIEDSVLKDRIGSDEVSQQTLVESIRINGQQVPILVRPSPTKPNFYQVAYGHRRLAACRVLERKVQALVRTLSDRDLLVAQGQENSARRDLSFIERASFALKLERCGLDRESIMAALSTDKTEISKLISVAAAVPNALVEAIGSAPKAGRPRWLGLVERLKIPHASQKLDEILIEPEFLQAASDDRFRYVFEKLAARPKRGANAKHWTAGDGKRIAKIERTDRELTLAISLKAAPEFGQFVVDQLPDLYAAYSAQSKTN